MSRPSTEAQYLASLLPPSVAATGIGRRSLLKGALTGAGFLGASGLLAACGSSGSSGSNGSGGSGTQAASGTLTFGSNQSDTVPKQAYAQLVTGFNDPSIKVTTNTATTTRSRRTSTPISRASQTTSSPGSRATG